MLVASFWLLCFFGNADSQLFSSTTASLWFPLLKDEIELILIKYKISFSLKELLLPSYLELGNAGWQGQIQGQIEGVMLCPCLLNSGGHLWVFFLKLSNFTVKLLIYVLHLYILVEAILALQKTILKSRNCCFQI